MQMHCNFDIVLHHIRRPHRLCNPTLGGATYCDAQGLNPLAPLLDATLLSGVMSFIFFTCSFKILPKNTVQTLLSAVDYVHAKIIALMMIATGWTEIIAII